MIKLSKKELEDYLIKIFDFIENGCGNWCVGKIFLLN